jgi:hypothetical protein
MPLFKELPKLFQHRDKNVRNATKDFFVEAYCWVGAGAVKSHLEKIPKIEQNIKECEEAWKDSQQKVFLILYATFIIFVETTDSVFQASASGKRSGGG